jgi:hypothetical protein
MTADELADALEAGHRQGTLFSPDRGLSIRDFQDPIAEQAGRHGPWQTVVDSVVVNRGDGKFVDTGWGILILEPSKDITTPVRDLQNRLLFHGLLNLGLLSVVFVAAWTFVFMVMSNTPRSRLSTLMRRRAGLASGSFSNLAGLLRSSRRSEASGGGLVNTPAGAEGPR